MFCRSLNLILVGFLTFSSVLSEICPPPAELLPCTCDESRASISCSYIREPWYIKDTFDRASKYISPDAVFNGLSILLTSLVDIPADSIPTIQFRDITISLNRQLKHIDPNAFGKTVNVTEYLSLNENNLNSEGSDEEDNIFRLISQFKKVKLVDLTRNQISKIPDQALSGLPNLSMLFLSSNNISSIGKSAFNGMVSYGTRRIIKLDRNQITADGISGDAFLGFNGKDSQFLLYVNPDLGYLDEQTFKSLLDSGASVTLDEVGETCDKPNRPSGYLVCDSKAEWLCENIDSYRLQLFGYCCDNSTDIWGYCNTRKIKLSSF